MSRNNNDFQERKKKRTEWFVKNIYGWKLRPCSACNGTGYYDTINSPKCEICHGTGKERYNSNEEQ